MLIRSRLLALSGLVLALALGSPRLKAAVEDERSLSLYNIHNGERLSVVYKRDGAYVPEGLEKLSWIFRDWRRNEATRMDPQAFDILWEVYQELGSKQPIHVISGFRSSRTNESLRRKGGGQAKNSQHIQGKALDVHFPDVPVQRLRYSALLRERGGVGYYPTSALPFVHIDTGRVRMWPRMPRQELALLFQNGRSKYVPTDGRPITPRDVEAARKSNGKLAETIMAFHEFRASPKDRTLVASLGVPIGDTAEPRLAGLDVPKPAPAKRPAAMKLPKVASLDGGGIGSAFGLLKTPRKEVFAARPVDEESRSALARLVDDAQTEAATVELASLEAPGAAPAIEDEDVTAPAPVAVSKDAFFSRLGWARQPDYDDDHDSELSYRPFPIAPLLTADPSIDNPALARLVHPDLKLAHDEIGGGTGMRLRFKPILRVAELMWADSFVDADVGAMLAGDTGSAKRRVKTANR